MAALRSVWHYNCNFRGGTSGWVLDQRMEHEARRRWQWNRQELGVRGVALQRLFLYNLWTLQ